MNHRMAKWGSLALACIFMFAAFSSALAETKVEMYDNAEPCYTCEFEIVLDDSFGKATNAWVYELSDRGRLACKLEYYYPLTWSSLQNVKITLGNSVFAGIFGNDYNTRFHCFDNSMIVQNGQITENPFYRDENDFLMFEMTREYGAQGEPSITMFTQLGEWDIEKGYSMTSSVVAMTPGTFRETVVDEDFVKKVYSNTAAPQYPATVDVSDIVIEEPEVQPPRVWPEWNILQCEEYYRSKITDTASMPAKLDVPYQAEFDIIVPEQKGESTWLYALSDKGNVHVTIREVANVPQCSVMLTLEGKHTIELLNVFPTENETPGFRTFDINKKAVEGAKINTYATNTYLGRICANFVKRRGETNILLIPDDEDSIAPVSGTFRETGTSTLFSKYDASIGHPDPTKDWEESKYLYNYYIDEDGVHHSFGTLRGDYYENSLRDFEIAATAQFEVPNNTAISKTLSTEETVRCTYYDINLLKDGKMAHHGYFLLKVQGNKGTQWFINGDYHIRRPENEIDTSTPLKDDSSIFMEFMPLTFLDGYDYEIYNSVKDNVFMRFHFSDATKKYMTDIDVNFENKTTNIAMSNIDYKGCFMQRFLKMVYADTWKKVCKEVGLNP